MASVNTIHSLRRFEIPGRVTLLEGNGDLPKIEVKTDWGFAEIYLHGAHVTDFRLNKQPPILFLSQCSRFANNQAIRGGVPVIFPWFGPREGEPMHGFARLTDWNLHETAALPDGGASLRFSLPNVAGAGMWSDFSANYVVTITDKLTMELVITNTSSDQQLSFDNCLHSYFTVGDITKVAVRGLKGATYLDKADGYAQKAEAPDEIVVSGEVDRTYLDTTSTVEILDRSLKRKILVEKSGSNSTVVWNPWIAKAQQMPDFGNDEYKEMICVESGNVARNKLTLPPSRSHVLKVTVSATPLS